MRGPALLLLLLLLFCPAALGEGGILISDDDAEMIIDEEISIADLFGTVQDETVPIADAQGLLRIADDPYGDYVLVDDIDLTGIDWQPLRFYGTLDGRGHTIRNLRVTSFDPETGRTVDGNGYKYQTNLMAFFSVVENASIRNLHIENAEIRGESEEHAFVAILAAIATHSEFENVSVSGSAALWCGAKMAGVGGLTGFGTGSITDSKADVTLVYVDTNQKTKCEQFLGGAVANGFMTCKNVTVNIDGYASVFGYAHCGGLIGMHRQHETRTNDNAITHVDDCTVTGRITFFERSSSRRAYCKGIIGELLKIEQRLDSLGDWLKARVAKKGGGRFTEGFVTASLLFCVGSMAIMGSFDAGLRADYTTIFTKSALDTVMAVTFGATMGIGVMFSGLTILVYQGALTLLAGVLEPLLSAVVVTEMSAVGGIMLMATALNILGLPKERIKVGNMLPALFVPVLYFAVLNLF